MTQITTYGFGRTLDGTVDGMRPRVEAALREEGFGVLTEIDIRATLKAKLDEDFRPYVILGACNPTLASKALHAEPLIGLMLPCNVLIQQTADGRVEVAFADPAAMFHLVQGDALAGVAEEAKARLLRAMNTL